MRKSILFACVLLASGSVYAGSGAHWGYSGHEGPENWAKLSPDNLTCAGKNQSPINLSGFIEADLPPIRFDYRPGGTEILNNGHTVQVNYEKGSHITLDGRTFNLLQFHFHAPSENHINGRSYPMEAHLVHADQEGNLAVVAVMFEEGLANRGLESAWSMMPKHVGEKKILSGAVGVDNILPENRDYYRFGGSLTTPPCSEGVRWLVMKEAVTASKQQIEAFAHVLHEPNNRPLQAVNARVVLQ
jgi:carbonic anhydrase